ncbi:hypothetical protein Hanom_Chr04g00372171 [Helianthus anomalus]
MKNLRRYLLDQNSNSTSHEYYSTSQEIIRCSSRDIRFALLGAGSNYIARN